MTTYYVDAATGDNDDTGRTELLAWATIQYAVTNSSNGDHVYIKASADYTETVACTEAASNSWRTYEGYTSTPGDGGKATIDATGETYGLSAYNGMPPPHNLYNRWENIIVENASGAGIGFGTTVHVALINIESNNNGGYGFSVSAPSTIVNCSASSNTGYGFAGAGALVACSSAVGNSTTGFYYPYSMFGCESISNSTYGIQCGGGGYPAILIGNTIDGDSKDTTTGISTPALQYFVAINNIIYDCATGISQGASTWRSNYVANNLLYSNTTNFTNVTDEHDNLTTDAPAFTDEAGGDYTLASGSAARNAGADASGTSSPGMDIGAHQSADAGGGGSRVIITG